MRNVQNCQNIVCIFGSCSATRMRHRTNAARGRGSAHGNHALFADCSKSPQRNATIYRYNKGAVRERRIGCPPQTSALLPTMPMQAIFCGCRCKRAGHSRPSKKSVLRPCEAIARARADNQIPPDKPQMFRGFHNRRQCRFPPPFHDTACIFCAQKSERLPGSDSCSLRFVVIQCVFCQAADTACWQAGNPVPPAQAPAQARPEYRWESAHTGTAG